MLKFLKIGLRENVLHRNYSTISPLRDYVDILQIYLQLDQKSAETIVNSKRDVFLRSPKDHVIYNSIMCQKCNVHINVTHVSSVWCLTYWPIHLHHKIYLLQDMGIPKITSNHIAGLAFNMSKTIHCFQKVYGIPKTVNTFQNLMKSVGIEWNDVPSSLRKVETVSMSKEMQKYWYRKFLEYFIYLRFGNSYEKILRHLKLTHYSLRLLDETIHYLGNEVGFSKDVIKKHPYLLQVRIEKARELLREMQDTTIDGTAFPEIVRKHPVVLLSKVENVKRILEVIKEYGIPEYAVTNYPKILTMNHDIFERRLALINEEYALKIWFQHPRILGMVIHSKKVWRQFTILNSKNAAESVYISAYLCINRVFHRHLEGEVSCAKALSLKYMLLKHLGIDDRKFVRFVMRHPSWRLAEMFDIDATLTYLKKHFTVDEIRGHVHIILYPVDAVAKMLEFLRQTYTPESGYNFTPAQYMSLCVYMFEKDRNFSGDSVCHVKEDTKWISNFKFEVDERRFSNDVYHDESCEYNLPLEKSVTQNK